jgi:ClpA/ClpB-like protein
VERTAIELAAASTKLGNPDEGLQAVTELRRRLDDLEAWHVENALREGRSWSQIADRLGVSKQAAHKKHSRRAGTSGRTFAASAREQGVVVTAEARRVVQHGAREAHGLGHARVGTGHLLLGLLSEPHAASAALKTLGVDLDVLRGAIKRPDQPERPPDGRMPISPQCREALERSLLEAVSRGERHLGVEHMLLALIRDKSGDAARSLDRLGVSPRAVEAALRR